MSCNETRVALYSKIPGTEGWSRTRILEHVRGALGEPTELEKLESGEVDWFSYDLEPPKGNFRRIKKGVTTVVQARREDRFWLVQHTLAHCTDYDSSISYGTDLTDLTCEIKKLEDKFIGIPHDGWFLFVQTWYNGSDEPVPTHP